MIGFNLFQVTCPTCNALLKRPRWKNSSFKFLNIMYRAGLTYPALEALWVWELVCTSVQKVLESGNVSRRSQISNKLLR